METLHNNEAEQALLGCMLIDEAIAMDVIDEIDITYFANTVHQEIFDIMKKLNVTGKQIDIVTVSNEGIDIGYLAELANILTLSSHKSYLDIVKDKARKRKLLSIAQGIIKDIADGDTMEVISKAEKDILDLTMTGETKSGSIVDSVNKALIELERRCNQKGGYPGTTTGFFDIDYKTGGLQKGDLIIIAGRPSMGKTSLAENIATHASLKERKTVLFFSMEMKEEKIINRMFSSIGLISNEKFKLGRVVDDDWTKIGEITSLIAESNLKIIDTPHAKASYIKTQCRKTKSEKGGLDLVVIDHLTEMWRPRTSKRESMEYEDNVRAMKRLALELDCPVILLQQLSRACEARTDKRPMLSDLKETGASEEVADIVILVYRDDYYNQDTNKKGIAEINIAKGRDVGIGVVELGWLPQYTKFQNLEWKRSK